MDRFCGSSFWDLNVTWDTNSPDFSECFEDTALLWPVCAFLWVASIFDIYFTLNPPKSRVIDLPTWLPAWTKLSITKISCIAVLISVEVAALCVNWIYKTEVPGVTGIPDVLWITPLVLILSHILSASLVVFHKSQCVHTSGFQLIHWSLLTMVHILIFRTSLMKYDHNQPGYSLTSLILLGIASTVMVLQSILFCWADIPKPKAGDHEPLLNLTEDDKEGCPMNVASFLSYILFSWCTPLVRKGNKSPLTLDELWNLVNSIRAPVVFPVFMRNFGKLGFGETRGIFRNIIKPLWATCGGSFAIGVFYYIISVSLTFFTPAVMGYLIDFVTDPSIQDWKGYMWAIMLFLINIVALILEEHFMMHFIICYSRILPSLSMNIYRKSLRITAEAKKETTTGEIVNLMSVDVDQIRYLIFDANVLIAAVIQLIIGVILLWLQLGLALLPGLGLLFILVPFNWFASLRITKLQRDQMKKKDERIKVASEVLSGMQVIKLYAWEPAYQKQIHDIRGEELRLIRNRNLYGAFMTLIFNSIPFLVSFGSFLTYVYWSGGVLDAKKMFVSLSLFSLLTSSLEYVPVCIAEFVDAQVSFNRINDFLNAPEFHPNATKFEEHNDDDNLPAIEIRDGTFSWDEFNTTNWKLSDINLEFQPKTLTAIVGSVASGKSSLLSAILGEMKFSGDVVIRGDLAYVPQIAWILNATLRENICFGLDYEKSKYDKIVEACCLTPDIEMLPAGDMTEIGEKGINLSGGQKQRVSLARAVYSGADIFLLDDVLSAVDSHVGKHIFDRLLGPGGLISGKTRIFCTHAYNFLSQVDRIVVMEEGRIVEKGTYDQLMEAGSSFSRLLSTHIQSKTNNNNNETEENVDDVKTDKPEKKSEDDGKLIEEEELETGDVKLPVYLAYAKALNPTLLIFLVIFIFTSEGFSLGRNIVLTKWSDLSKNSNATGITASVLPYVIGYASFGVSQAVFCYIGFILLTIASIRAARVLHNDMLSRILRAPMSFFNVTPLGRITNRFSSDVEKVDNEIPNEFGFWLELVSRFIGILVAITYTNWYFLVAIMPLCVGYYFLQRYYIKCTQQLQRIQSSCKSPIYAQFQETLDGTSSIRAYKAEDRFIGKLAEKIDQYSRATFPMLMLRRWLGVRLGTLGAFVVLIPAMFAVIWRSTANPSLVGLAITYSLNVVNILSLLVKVTSELQYLSVSVERMLEYSEVEQEEDYENTHGGVVSPKWPEKGEIEFKNYETRYRSGLDLVLKDFSCLIKSGEKIGIVGRTGAGKSSLTLALFRIIESVRGNIFIDQVDIANLGLHDVRRRLTVIPQDPVLFSRTLRLNIDPFEEYQDGELWEALRLAHLREFVKSQPEGLSYLIAEGGENLSVGQRQLVCLARAVLRKSAILVLDEATASVDSETDGLIQKTIREHFAGCTILNVAHRLNTVMDSSRILVLGKGEILEFDTPQVLLSDSNSHFFGMAKDAGIVN